MKGTNTWTGLNYFGPTTGGVAGGQFGSNPFNYLSGISKVFVSTATAANPSLPFQAALVQDGAGGFNFPTAVSGLGQLNHTGYLAFGGNFIGEQFTTGAALGTEIDANNFYGAPTNSYPPDYSVSGLVTKVYPVGQQTMCGGNFNCYFAYGAGQNSGIGSGGQWLTGYYTWPAAIATFGVLIDADATHGPQYSAFLKNTGTAGNANLVLNTTGTLTTANTVLYVTDANSVVHLQLQQGGGAILGHHLATTDYTIAAPTVSSCGTSPAQPTGNDTAGYFATGTLGTSCTLTFTAAYATKPVCFLQDVSGATASAVNTSTAAMTMSGLVASSFYFYFCVGL